VADLSGILVGVRVVDGIWELIFEFLGCLALDGLRDREVAGVGHALALLVLGYHFGGGGADESGCGGGFEELIEGCSEHDDFVGSGLRLMASIYTSCLRMEIELYRDVMMENDNVRSAKCIRVQTLNYIGSHLIRAAHRLP
jgi:hypothetical protein